ncbi:MAG: hypothetical protein J7578_08790 [Chitinophagaceae bacterium]|nr:hypothetical protein [Chitinophagaceae bacterium]
MSSKYILSTASILLTLLLNACSKRELNAGNPATIQVFNALNDGTGVYINLTDARPEIFKTNRLLNSNTFVVTSNRFYLNASPQPIQFYSRLDTLAKDIPILTGNLEYQNGSIYSLFIYGSKSTAQYIWHQDVIPPLGMGDSVTNIRFANFSEDQAISVNLKGQPAGSFIQQVQLRSFSDFVKLPANITIAKYEFEIRDLSTGGLIASYVADKVNDFTGNTGNNAWYNKSNTLVLVGKQGGTGTLLPKLVLMPHR